LVSSVMFSFSSLVLLTLIFSLLLLVILDKCLSILLIFSMNQIDCFYCPFLLYFIDFFLELCYLFLSTNFRVLVLTFLTPWGASLGHLSALSFFNVGIQSYKYPSENCLCCIPKYWYVVFTFI
jgi:hypothetical protein